METVTLNISRDDFLTVIDDSIKISKKRWTRFVKSQINLENESIESSDEVVCFLPDPPSPIKNNGIDDVDGKNDYNCQSLSKDVINTDNYHRVLVENNSEKSYTTNESNGVTSSQSVISPIDLLFSATTNIVPQDDIDDEDSYSDDEDSYSDDEDSDSEESHIKDSQFVKNEVKSSNSDYFDDDPDEESDEKLDEELNDESANGVANRTVFEENNVDYYSDDEDSDEENITETDSQAISSLGVAEDSMVMPNISHGGSTVVTNVFSDSDSYDDNEEDNDEHSYKDAGDKDLYEDDDDDEDDDEFKSFSDVSHNNLNSDSDSDSGGNDTVSVMQIKSNIDTLSSNSVTVNSSQTISSPSRMGVQKLEYSSKNVEDVCKNTEPTDIINEGVNRFGHVVNFTPDMSLIAFLRANKSIREEDEILCYFTKEDIKLASRQGKIILKKGRVII